MKARSLLTKAKKELKTATEKRVVEMLKKSMKNIQACVKTLDRLREEHETLLNLDISKLETDDFEY